MSVLAPRRRGADPRSTPALVLAAAPAMALAALLPLESARPAAAQEPAEPRPAAAAQADSLRAEVARLRARVDSLTALVTRLRLRPEADSLAAPPPDDLAALRAAAEAAAEAAAREAEPDRPDAAAAERGDTVPGAVPDRSGAPRPAPSSSGQQSLNPEITVTGDVFGFVDLDRGGGPDFVARNVELLLQSALDPYSRARIFVGYHDEGGELTPFGGHDHEDEQGGEPHDDGETDGHGHGGGFAIEEAYVQWAGLPGGLNLYAGRFRQNFGTLNRWHLHALPGQSYPLPYVAFFGEEGLAQTGVGVHWLVPWGGLGTWELWTEVTASGNEALFGVARSPAVLGRVNGFWDIGRSTYFELGASGVAGPDMHGDDDFATRVGGADFTLSWRPPERGRYREATLRGGVVYGRVVPEGPRPDPAFGAFAVGEYRLDRRWIVGARYEYTENPLDPTESAWLAAPTLTWWQSEWVRLRAELDWLGRPGGTQKLLVLQATFAMGPHRHETY